MAALQLDPEYRFIMLGESQWPDVRAQKEYIEQLLAEGAEYLDKDIANRLKLHFHQCFWEAYLVYALRSAGVELVARSERVRADYGPDIQLRSGAWIEAIAVTAGAGTDAVRDLRPGSVGTVPDDGIKLRILAGMVEKQRKFEGYRSSGLVAPDAPCVVAINGALVPSVRLERTVPRVVRALLEIGNEVFVVDRQSGRVVERTHDRQTEIRKSSGATVPQGSFLDGSASGISACLYSHVDAVNRPPVVGPGFVTVHNPTADQPLPKESFKLGSEWWVDDGKLEHIEHGKP